MSALESALRLVDRGLAVFPVSAARVPLVKGWTTGAATNADEVERMFAAFPEAPCVGVSTGQSGVDVLDFDLYKGGDVAYGRILMDYGDEWQDTVTAITPRGGRHYYYSMGGQRLRSTRDVIGKYVDTRAIGGFAVAPTSVGKHGVYRWVDGHSPEERAMMPVPDWIVALTRAPSTIRTKRAGRTAKKDMLSPEGSASKTILTCTTLVPTPGSLKDLNRDDGYILLASRLLGIPDVPFGTAFLCVLEDDTHPSAALFQHVDGQVRYHDFHHAGQDIEWLSLAEVYAAQVTRHIRKLHPPEHVCWQLRLCHALGIITPVDVPMAPLPPTTPPSVATVYSGIRLLFGLKWWYSPGEPSPLTWRFLADWCGVAQETADKALKVLVALNTVAPVGQCRTTYGKTMTIYLPVESER